MNKVKTDLSEYWIGQLKASGYKLTGPRYYVVDILAHTDKALTALDIYTMALDHYPSIGLVSVYRTLDKLELLGLIQRVHHQEKCQAYIASPGGHEHLLVCRECGKVSFFKGDNLEGLVNDVERKTSYRVEQHWLQLIGVCAECQEKENNSLSQ